MTLQARNVTLTYPGGRRALTDVTCDIQPASITAIVGPNGSGKSSLLRLLSGVRHPDSGGVFVDDAPLRSLTPRARARRVALVTQHPSVAFGFDTRRVVAFGAEGAGRPQAAADRAIERFGLADLAAVPFDALSVGQRQRVSLARAFAQIDGVADQSSDQPAYLLADEPISAMDPKHAAESLRAFRALAQSGVGVGLVLHDLSAAARIADHAVLLASDGTLAGQGPASDLLTAERLSDLYATPIARAEAPGIGPVLATLDAPPQ